MEVGVLNRGSFNSILERVADPLRWRDLCRPCYRSDVETAFTFALFLWAPLSAWIVRAVVVRLLFGHVREAAYIIAYLVWIGGFLTNLWFVEWSGMRMYGFDRTDPWQFAGWVAMWLSPFGLPLVVGAPIIFVVDVIRFAVIAHGERKSSAAK